jgi:hypothetical protein
MTPIQFLNEASESIHRALSETLRYDYGPAQSKDYFEECTARLKDLDRARPAIDPGNQQQIADHLRELLRLERWISLIERSHLGEFSWPFAEELSSVAMQLLTENDANGPLRPIIHIIAEGQGYQIVYERQVPAAGSRRRFGIVAFPRSLKHHVLLHTIFGHELGHAALYASEAGRILKADVVPALRRTGSFATEAAANAWLTSRFGQGGFKLNNLAFTSWLVELICDLFGLLLFGPAFFAAHRTILRPRYPTGYEFSSTHPPYAVRHKLLVRAMNLLNWHLPIIDAAQHANINRAENDLLNFILEDGYDPWAAVFDDAQLQDAIAGIRKVFTTLGPVGYAQSEPDTLVAQVRRLMHRLPPILANIDSRNRVNLVRADFAHSLLAGWIYWMGRPYLTPKNKRLTFWQINRLCDQALLQEQAIAIAARKGRIR